MKIQNSLQIIEALGNLLCYYNSDLYYIACFHNFINGKITETKYLQKEKGYFKSFLIEYRIARNVKKERIRELLLSTKNWVSTKKASIVDDFALALRDQKITHDGKTMTSLASKILFLNNPEEIIPMDRFNKTALNIKSNSYSDFKNKVENYKSKNMDIMKEYLSKIDSLLSEIEKNYKGIKINFNDYRISRFSDKILWTTGKK